MHTLIVLFVGFTAAYGLIWHFQSSQETPERRPGQKTEACASGPDAAHPDKGSAERAGDIARKV